METFHKVIDLLYLAKQDGVEVVLNEDRLQIKVAENRVVDQDLLKEIRNNKQLLIDYLSDNDRKIKSTSGNNKIPRFNRDAVLHIPASFSQERLWFIDSMGEGAAYHLPAILRLTGLLNTEALQQALQTIVERHEALRTVFYEQDGLVYQSFKESSQWQLQLVDGTAYKNDPDALKIYIETLVGASFNLAHDYSVRATLIKLAEDVRVLIVTIHHIASDAWSVSVMVQELIELYDAFAKGNKPHLLPLPLQYADYAVWQRNYLQGTVLESKVAYWKDKLEGTAALQLPTDYQRPVVQNTTGERLNFRIGKTETEQLRIFCRQQGVTLFMALLSVYKVLLYRYSGQSDICVGTSLASRRQQELEGLIGFFVNTLALRDELNPDASFITLLQQVRITTLDAYEHQDVPFEKVVEAVVKERDPNRSPLFQVMLVLANTPPVVELRLGEVVLSEEGYDQEIAKFDFTCFINEESDGLSGSIQYAASLYSTATIERMSEHFVALISSVISNPQQKTGLLSMLSSTEETQLLQDFNSSQVVYPTDKSIVALFEEQVSNVPQHTALVFEEETLTYQQLNERSNQLAHYLNSKGVHSSHLVPLYMERSADMLIGILGILKAGAAYVPVDTALPADRLRYLLQDTNAKLIVCHAHSTTRLQSETDIQLIEIEDTANQPTANLTAKPLANDLAYVIYTSGSTGTPKGVMITHRSLVDYYYGLDQQVHISQCSSFALVSTIATDLGNTVLLGSLLSGGALHVFSKASVSNIEYLHRYFQQHIIDCLKIVPSHWKALRTDEALLLPKQLLVFGGEALPAEVVGSIQQSGSTCRIVNHYGPTETTIGKLLHPVATEEAKVYGSTLPIGKPFSNTQVYVLTKELQLCPVGVPGQLYIAGHGLASGYLNNPELTKKKFIANPFTTIPNVPQVPTLPNNHQHNNSHNHHQNNTYNHKEDTESHSRMYATGDRVLWLADGNIQFIGRVDDQVKIRGYRVEPGEVSSVLLQHEDVKTGVVLASPDKQGNQRLVAYVVPQYPYSFERDSLLTYLKEQLPDYMVPSVLITLEEMPLTANGKIDRRALPDADTAEQGSSSGEYVAPRNETEAKMAAIWADVLEEEEVSVEADFFELGGHSLLAVRLVSAIRKAFEVEMPIGDIFDYPTVALLATRLNQSTDTPVLLSIEKVVPRPQQIPLSFSQERLWFIDQLSGSANYHIPFVVRLQGVVDKEALDGALQQIINRHEVLRTVIGEEDGTPYQTIQSANDWALQLVNGSSYKDNQTGLEQYLWEYINAPFNLAIDFPVRAALISLAEQEHLLAVTLHHIASDGYSTAIMVQELSELYKDAVTGRAASLPGLPVQYADYALWQRRYLQGAVWENKLQYWKDKLQGTETLQLLTDYPRPLVQSTRGAVISYTITEPLANGLKTFSQQQGTTLYMTLLAAFNVLLHKYTGQSDICVGTPVAGRQQQELEGLIGLFVNTVALRNEIISTASFTELLQQVRTTTLAAYEQQDVPFEKVVEAVVKERDMSRSPLFQVMLVLQNTPERGVLQLGNVALSEEAIGWQEYDTAKFDLTFNITELPAGLHLSIEYSTDLYKRETVERMAGHFATLLQSSTANPSQAIGSLPMLSGAEKDKLLVDFNNTTAAYLQDQTFIGLFEQQAAKLPQHTALVFEEQTLTYAGLNAKANQLAHYLMSKGVGAEMLVPVCIERSLEMLVAILGVLKAGAAYVPVDPTYPRDRISFMLNDVAATIIISNKKSISVLPSDAVVELVDISGTSKDVIDGQPTHNLSNKNSLSQLAYVIYTSGSTGQPKGVMIEHGSLLNYLLNHKAAYTNGQNHHSGSFHHLSYTFDASITPLFMPLLAGKSIVIASPQFDNVFEDPNLLKYAPYDFIKITPSHLPLLEHTIVPGAKWIADKLVIGGEALHSGHLSTFIDRMVAVEVINEYGPTESTVGCSTYTLHTTGKKETISNIPIGKPIGNINLYLADDHNGLVPIGVAGEICIAGAGLARGYWNQPDLTAEKFIPNPFSHTAGTKMYRTGDLGRWLPDGNMEYLGRKDEQVKVSGYRIELGEIEAALQQSGLVSNAIIAVKENNENVQQLIGYVVTSETVDRDGIVNYLKTKLPAYMVPQLWVPIEQVPLTPNGKVDRKALPDPDVSAMADHYVAPTNTLEAKLAVAWQNLLAVEQIGIHDNFFERGGHSLLAMRLVSLIRKEVEVEVSIRDLFFHPTIASLAAHLAHQQKGLLLPPIQPVYPRPVHTPLSFSQERLWFIHQLGGSVQYHVPAVLRLQGKLHTTALANALQQLVQRHEVLRTVMLENAEGYPYQSVRDASSWQLQQADGRSLANQNGDLHHYIAQFINQPFHLSTDYMLRAAIVNLEAEENLLVITLHHIASDEYSAFIMAAELTELYKAQLEKRTTNLPPLSIQYADYALWQRKYLQGEAWEKKVSYWREKLQGVATLQLPTDFARPAVQSSKGSKVDFEVSVALTEQLAVLGQQHNATLFMTLLAAFKTLLYRYSGQPDICVGTPITGRQQHELEPLIGFFSNTLALRSTINPQATFIDLLQQVQANTLQAYDHQEVPFEKVVETVVKERDLSRSPLFQVMLVVDHAGDHTTPDMPGLTVLGEPLESHTSKYDFSFYFTQTAAGLQGYVEYATDLYAEATIHRLIGHYQQLLSAIVENPATQIGYLPMLTPAEQRQLLVDFNNTQNTENIRLDGSIVTLFEQQAAATPENIAIQFEAAQLTYAELNRRANQLARYLLDKGVTQETLVPICLEKSEVMLVAILGILKTGAAFVPVDPQYPPARISYMLADTSASILVSTAADSSKLTDFKAAELILIDEDWPLISQKPHTNLPAAVPPDSLAYVIYTSGSTGQPKGVMVQQGSVVNLVQSVTGIVSFSPASSFLSVTTFSFDISYLEFFVPLLNGGKLVLVEKEAVTDGFALSEKIAAYRPTHLQATPATWQLLVHAGWQNKEGITMLVGGEAVGEAIKNELTQRGNVYNCYGPTETTIWSTIQPLQQDEPVLIGRPIANTTIYILSDELQLAPVGVTGEISIGGAGLARGYLNRPELTAEKFIPNPFTGGEGSLIYRTGDLGRRLPDGTLECFGRKDDQVKIRGYRIELGEIETILQESVTVSMAVVAAKKDRQGNLQLVAYVIPAGTFNREEATAQLAAKLPAYMVPQLWVEIVTLPLTPNGKLDRKALPDPDINTLIENNYVAPTTAQQQALVTTWQHLLGIKQIGIHDNFFELGGHSLLAMRLASMVRRDLEVELSIKDLFLNPTISALATHLSGQQTELLLPPIEPVLPRPEFIPLSFSQERLWVIHQLEGSTHYHIPAILRLSGHVDASALSQAFRQIISRHEALRTVILENGDGQPYQSVQDAAAWQLEQADSKLIATCGGLQNYLQQFVSKPFILSEDYMVRATLVNTGEVASEYLLAVNLHHIASDGYSASIMAGELAELYNAQLEQRPALLPALPVQYADYALWQRNYLQGETLENKISYWKTKLQGATPLELPVDFTRPAIAGTAGATLRFAIDKSVVAQADELGRRNSATLFMVLMAAFKTLLYRYSSQPDICSGTPVAGRQQAAVEGLIGFFVNTLALRTRVNGSAGFAELLHQVKTTALEAYEYQDVPFEKVVDAVVKERDVSRSPLFQAMLILQNIPAAEEDLYLGEAVLSASEITPEDGTAKFELTFSLSQNSVADGDGMQLAITYSTELYREETIEKMAAHFINLLQSAVQNPVQPIGLLPMLTATEEKQLVETYNDTYREYPGGKTIVDLFEEQAGKTPDTVAFLFEQQQITYKQLNEQSNQLAYYLQSKGVAAETLVPICVERSLEMTIGILGILKAGAAYVPIDPTYPAERIQYMLEDSNAGIVISSSKSRTSLNGIKGVLKNRLVIEIDGADSREILSTQPVYNLQTSISPRQLAYIIYTSGSTGRPKGVMIEHDSVYAFICWCRQEFAHSRFEIVYATTSICFDLSVYELFYPLSIGKPVRIVENGLQIAQHLPKDQHVLVNTVPSVVQNLLRQGVDMTAISVLNMAGEPIPVVVQQGLDIEKAEVRNLYGPSEDTTYSTMHRLQKGAPVTIGKPIANTGIFILNAEGGLVPQGAAGEICIAGLGLARGYLNQADLTAEKFIPNPYSSNGNERLYRTGDLGRWLPDGNIAYLGRRDEQVKVRGYRIELGEIETVLQQSGLVKQSVIVARQDKQGNKQLVAYVVTSEPFDKESVIVYLSSKLPAYMVPQLWMQIEALPLTANGKIDKKALPDIEAGPSISDAYTAPRTQLEVKLAETWQELLDVPKIGIHDNFFERGGDSILTIQLVSRMRRLGYELHPKDLFVHQTISKLSVAMAERSQTAVTGEQGILTGYSGLLPIQHWYLEKNAPVVSHFNQALLLGIDKTVTTAMLQQAVGQLLLQHDALRFTFSKTPDGSEWQQEYSYAEAIVYVEDVRTVDAEALPGTVKEKANNHQRQLHIERGELVRVVKIETPDFNDSNRLLLIIHHLAVDGVSWRILLEDIEALLTTISEGQQLNLGTKTSSYRQWYMALQQYGKTSKLLSQTTYWQKIIESYQPLPVDKNVSDKAVAGQMGSFSVTLNAALTRQLLQEVPQAYHTEINDLLLCALFLTLCRWSGSNQVVIGLEGHGRETISEGIDTSRTVGWFTSLYPVLLQTASAAGADQQIKSIKEQLRQVPDKGLGFGVLKYINKAATLQTTTTAWDIIFNYLGQLDNVVSKSKWLKGAGEYAGTLISETYKTDEKLSVNSSIQGGELQLTWRYSQLHYEEETITQLASAYTVKLQELIEHCLQQAAPVFTPSDYGLGADISYVELDRFLDEPFEGKKRKDHFESVYRLSGLQQGMLFHSLYDEQVEAYTQQFTCNLTNADVELLTDSWQQILKNHSVLRSSFHYDVFSIPVQCVYRQVSLPVQVLDYRSLNPTEQAAAIEEFEVTDRSRGFNFTQAPLMRITLIQTSNEQYHMVWTFHHILFDGWSLPVLMEEFLTTYESLAAGRPVQQQEDKYEEYIRYIERSDTDAAETYWRQYLEGVEQNTLLPFISPTAQRTKGKGTYRTVSLRLDTTVSQQIQAYAHQQHLTISTIMQGVWSLLLQRYTGNNHVVFGMIVAGRPDSLPDIEHRVGMYINTLPIHAALQQEQAVTEWLQTLQNSQVASLPYQYTPLQTIQSWSGITGDLFDSILVFENYPVSKIATSGKWLLSIADVQTQEQTNYPLTITVNSAETIHIGFSYNTSLLDEAYVERIKDHFEHVVTQLTANETVITGEIELITPAEKHRLLAALNDTNKEYSTNKTLVHLLQEQAAKTPDGIAVVFEENQLTYRQLHERSNQLAHYLVNMGVTVETLVPLCLERSLEMIIGIIGILKAGGAYVPIDPEYPIDRISFMLRDTAATMVLTDAGTLLKIGTFDVAETVALDEHWPAISQQPVTDTNVPVMPHHLAYVIYTSGSTGRPKGVMNEHSGIVNRLLWAQDYFGLTTVDAVLQKTTFAFDVSVWELLWPLLVGAKLVFAKPGGQKDVDYLKQIIRRQHITMTHFVPSMLSAFLAQTEPGECQGLQKVLCSGEALQSGQAALVAEKLPHVTLYNLYGPTEAAIDVTCWAMPHSQKLVPVVPIGKPIANVIIYILDRQNRLVPEGGIGELCIGGIAPGRGYLNLADLTAGKFVKDPFRSEAGARIYKTGDLAKWLPDGNIEYLGRIDDQVKIRGYRIELGEIENALQQSEWVKDAAVLAKGNVNGDKILIAYIVPALLFSKEAVTSYLNSRLPGYMVPQLWVEMESLPLTANGKLNRKGLPDADLARLVANDYVEPRNELELKLVNIWKEVLSVNQVGVRDNFFDLGGHSLLVMRLIAAIKTQLKVDLAIKMLFELRTVEDVANYIHLSQNNYQSEFEEYDTIEL